MLYLIGLGLDVKGISLQGLEATKKCKKIYLENYTVDFPYSLKELEKSIERKIIPSDRNFVENGIEDLVKEAKKENVALLVYGSPLTATTHMSLIQEAKEQKVEYEIIYSASILDAISETGLQSYKFGKIASMPKWDKEKNFKPESFVQIIKENNSISSHSLILIDIGLDFKEALKQFEVSMKNRKLKLDKIIVCSSLGKKQGKIFCGKISKLKNKKIVKPYCLIIPSKLHFVEKEVLKDMEI
jgi:diphthine synthase